MKNQNIAILVVEFQKTWTQESFFYSLIKKELEGKKVLEHSIKILNIAREYKINIIQSPFIIDKSNTKSYKNIPLLPKLLGQFTANTWRSEYTDGIYQEGDYEVTGRTAFDNTVDSNLVEILNKLNTKTVYLMGFTTDHCVAETMDSLIKLGYETILISDATATIFHSSQLKIENKYNSISSCNLIESITSRAN